MSLGKLAMDMCKKKANLGALLEETTQQQQAQE
jgi:hypothetical protein